MKFLHLSDLHIGKRVNDFSQIEDQHYILLQILNIIDENGIEIIVIAGDVYDKTVPTAESVSLFDWFLCSLARRNKKVLIISGNHDSAERLSFGSAILQNSDIYISKSFDGKLEKVSVDDTDFYLLPFLKPANVRGFFEDKILTYNDAIKVILNHTEIDNSKQNVLVTHQFVTGASCCGSEEITVGGSDNVDYKLFDDFDYVALGHIHGPQSVGRETVRYCGTPLKYSFSECSHKKSVTIVSLENKKVDIKTLPLMPKRDLIEIKGNYEKLVSKSYYSSLDTNAYYHIILTDEEDVVEALSKLRVIYPNIMKLSYDNKRTRKNNEILADETVEQKSPFELFSEFFESQNNRELSDFQKDYIKNLLESREEA